MSTKSTHRLLLHNTHVVTAQGPDRGPLQSWAELGWLEDAAVVVEHVAGQWQTVWLGARGAADQPVCAEAIDLGGRLLTPGWIDCHTHAVFAGDRSHEFGQRLTGRSYADIAAAGGGILHTVKATRAATVEALVAASSPRLAEMAAWGTRVVEVKTGYGLDLAAELKTLDAIAALQAQFAGRLQLVATAMPAHAVPPEYKGNPDGYIDAVCQEILPALAKHPVRPRFCDVFVESGYFSVDHADRMLATARQLGLGMKAHVDELSRVGGLPWAVAAGAVSVEHLLCTDAAGVALLGQADTVAVGLPLTSLFLREPLAPLRDLVDAGARVAVATDCNPGSSMTANLPLAMQMAVLMARLTPPEALRAVTRCAALALAEVDGLTGRIAVGERFDATLLDATHPDALFYQFASPPRHNPLLVERLLVASQARVVV